MPDSRLNDGRCDRAGRFVIGGHEFVKNKTAQLFSCEYKDEQSLRVSVVTGVPKFICANGLVFSQDGTKMYFVDSPSKIYNSYQYDMATGQVIGKPEKFHTTVQYPDREHIPDGSCLDSQGYIWNAHWDGKCAELLTEGENGLAQVLKRVEFPVSNVTCVCLGGTDMNWLFATTASLNTDREL